MYFGRSGAAGASAAAAAYGGVYISSHVFLPAGAKFYGDDEMGDEVRITVIATGLPAGPGAATGKIYFNADRAVIAAEKGEKVLLVRVETSPEDLRGMIAAEGILTARGGVSSHAALVARQMGKVCVCGAAAVQIDYDKKTTTIDGQTFSEGDFLSIDGTAGTIYGGKVKTGPSSIVTGLLHEDHAAQATEKFKNFLQLMKWCEQSTKMAVRTNADTPEQTRIAAEDAKLGANASDRKAAVGNWLKGMKDRNELSADEFEAVKVYAVDAAAVTALEKIIAKAAGAVPGHQPPPPAPTPARDHATRIWGENAFQSNPQAKAS